MLKKKNLNLNKLWKRGLYMLQIQIVACQSHEQDQLERVGNHFSEENRINLDQASQRPVRKSFKFMGI